VDAQDARGRPLFAVTDDVYRWEDVVGLARVRGDWEALANEVRAGLRALAELGAPDAEQVDAAQAEFRYARGLIAGDDLEAWLDRRGLTVEDWTAYCERRVARASLAEPPELPLDDEAVEANLWAEGVCSGLLEQTAQHLARMTAVAPGVPLEHLEQAFVAFCESAAAGERMDRMIHANQLEWLRFAYEAADFAEEDAALEAALCIRSDGDSLGEVASRAGAACEPRREWLDELPPELVPPLLAARPGALIGPVQVGDRYRLALLHEKQPPDPGDEAVRARARAAVIERAVTRETNERVVWLERL
jgi:hypothetical protein